MARQSIPRIIDDHLIPPGGASQSFPAIQVGSDTWYAWLSQPASRSFAFHSPQGTLTARREHRHGTWYWYAYRTQDGRLHKAYLGKSEELTLVRLHEAAALLSAERVVSRIIENPPQEAPDTLRPPQPPTATPLPSVASTSSLHLLTTKISVPPVRLNMVTRPRLIPNPVEP